MKRKSTTQSARALIALLVCGAACSIATGTLLAFLHSELRPSNSKRTLTFAERVSYQRAIEEVYWRHRIWPKENPDRKPSLDVVMSQAQLENKVASYLRDSLMLEDYWQRPITADQLQAEIERTAQHTKQPEVLRELFAALRNDPFIIAECLARPVLAERLLPSEQIPRTTRIHEQVVTAEGNYTIPSISDTGTCTVNTWTATSTINAPSPRTRHTAVWTGSEMIIWGGFSSSNGGDYVNTGRRYVPSTDSWMPISTNNAPPGRDRHTAVWTGTEVIVWGGFGVDGYLRYFDNGGRYNPTTNSWRETSPVNAPSARVRHTAVWTGSEMIVWGGFIFDQGQLQYFNSGGRYNPNTDTWRATSITNAPAARSSHRAVWTSSEMIVWGGGDQTSYFNTGGRYDPSTNSWTATRTSNTPTARQNHTAVWTGNEMIVWGGSAAAGELNTGGKYNPGTNTWTRTTTNNAPSGRELHTAVWTGSQMIVWGGYDGAYLDTGGKYDPDSDSWTATRTASAPDGRSSHTAVWTGTEMILWGGTIGDFDLVTSTGGRYCAPGFPAQLGNISTRSFVQTGDNVMIGGFIVQGTGPKRVIIRAIGPELGTPPYNIANALANPTLELHNTAGALIGSNDDWQHTIIGGVITRDQVTDIQNSGHAPASPFESAIIADLPPGNYTAIVRGVNNTTGVGLVEVYDLANDHSSILGNISTRSFAQTDDNVMIGGFIVQGTGAKRVIIRAIGPELGAPPYNIPNALANPILELHNGSGTLIGSNDDWQHTIIGGIITQDQVADIQNSGHAPANPFESAIIADLPPGNYTAIVRGVNDTTGVGLVEVYDLH